MDRLVEFDLGGEGKILFETGPEADVVSSRRPGDPARKGVAARGKGKEELVEKASQSLEDALDHIRPAAQLIVDKLRDVSPQEIEVEFGVRLEAEAGVVITKTKAEAHFKIVLKWKK